MLNFIKTRTLKKIKPEVDAVLNEVVISIYNELVNDQGASLKNMQIVNIKTRHNDKAISRNVIIDIIIEKGEREDPNNDANIYCEKILSDYYGEIVVDYVVDFLMNKNKLIERNIPPREIKVA